MKPGEYYQDTAYLPEILIFEVTNREDAFGNICIVRYISSGLDPWIMNKELHRDSYDPDLVLIVLISIDDKLIIIKV